MEKLATKYTDKKSHSTSSKVVLTRLQARTTDLCPWYLDWWEENLEKGALLPSVLESAAARCLLQDDGLGCHADSLGHPKRKAATSIPSTMSEKDGQIFVVVLHDSALY